MRMVSQSECRIFWGGVILSLLCSGAPLTHADTYCNGQPLEQHEDQSAVVVSGHVIKVLTNESEDKTESYTAKIQIKRVFKGNAIVSVIPPVSRSQLKTNPFVNYNKKINVNGFRHDVIGSRPKCVSEVIQGDTKIFFLDYNTATREFDVRPPIVPLSVYHLDRVDAAVNDIPFNIPPPTISPCLSHFCPFYGTCLVNTTSNQPYCACVDTCTDELAYPVCGSDGWTHNGECLLRLASCHKQRRLTVQHEGPCNDPCAGVVCDGQQTCRVNPEKKPVCKCEVSCEARVDPVCGSDGNTYSNQCLLKQQACLLDKDIVVLYNRKCSESNPCTQMKCNSTQDCLVDRRGQASCVCPSVCENSGTAVCGTDGVSYESSCHLRRVACEGLIHTDVLHSGNCSLADTERENEGMCKGHQCAHEWDQECIVKDGRPSCQCPTCQSPKPPFDPICGDNGIIYEHDCERRRNNCLHRTQVKVEHRGFCVDNCDKNKSLCKHYSVCETSSGMPRCVCQTDCVKTNDKVCGTDGITYASECELRVASCINHVHISITSFGECEDCNGIQCLYGSQCVEGQCVCPQTCPLEYESVCASDGNTYRNQCEMLKVACRSKNDLKVVRPGDCNYDGSGSGEEGSGALQDCDDATCLYGGTCEQDYDGSTTCKCSFSCDAIRSPVCGSDGVTYGNRCELQVAKCQQQIDIVEQSLDSCDGMDEILCDGLPPVQNTFTGQPYACAGGQGCPSGSYCHLQFGQCCSEAFVTETYIRDCTESRYGCCDDQLTFAPDVNKDGCPDRCQCNPIGALRTTCDPSSRQCSCKPGVGGLRCDRCLPRYWGLNLLQENDKRGCMPCNCHPMGAAREDCKQNTGRCICRPGYDGHKCGRCKKSGYAAGNLGCEDDASTATPIPTLSRKTPRHITNRNMTNVEPRRDPTIKPPIRDFANGEGRIDDLCEEDSYCPIPHSHCIYALCRCDPGYIPTHQSTVCSKVEESFDENTTPAEDTCSMEPSPCRHGGVCKLDDSLGYKCLCTLGHTGFTCTQRTSFDTPSFSGSSYVMLKPLGRLSGDLYLDIAFISYNSDGIILFASQNTDGTGQFMSLALSNGQVEFRYDTGNGPKQIRHPFIVTKDSIHQVIVQKTGQNTIVTVDDKPPIAAVTLETEESLNLSGKLFLGSLTHNMSFVQEKIGMNLGFVGCIHGLKLSNNGNNKNYVLQHPSSSSDILYGVDVDSCEKNACQQLPCKNGGSCIMLNTDIYECICRRGYSGSDCEKPEDICMDSPCHMSATCALDESGEIICHCPDTREGQYCEYEKLAEVEVPEFHGDSYLVLPVSDNLSTHTSIELWFMTKQTNGMLVYASQYLGGKGDYISLNIVDLSVQLRFNLGSAPVLVKSTQKLSLNSWHRVSVKRALKKAELTIDGGPPSTGETTGSLTELQLPGSLNLGGYSDRYNIPGGSGIRANLTGVIQRVYINGHLVEEPISASLEAHHVTQYTGTPCNVNPCMNGGVCVPRLEQFQCRCTKRYYGHVCEKVADSSETSRPVRFDGSTYLIYRNDITAIAQSQRKNKIQFQFHTHQSSGMLIFQGDGTSVTKDYLAVAISNGYVELSYNLGKQTEDKLLRSRSSVYVSDGEWHTVHVERDNREGLLQVDKEAMVTVTSQAGAMQLNTDGALWIGGKSDLPRGLPLDYYRGFKGCLGHVFISDKTLHLYNDRQQLGSSSIDFCH